MRLLMFEGNFLVQAPGEAYSWRGDLTEGFLRYELGGLYLEGLIPGGAYFRNFTVILKVVLFTSLFGFLGLPCLMFF